MALTLHLGAHKTASTHLQVSLRLARRELRAGGVFYADPGVLRHDGLPLVRALTHGGRAARVVSERLAEARACCPELLLSDENILGGTHRSCLFSRQGMIYPGVRARLRRCLALAGGGPAVLCLSVRDPAQFNVSAFALQLALGNEIEIDAYLQGRDPAALSWSGLAQRLASVPGVARLLVWRYEDYPALRPRLLARILPPGLAALVPEPPPSNESLTQPGYEWFLRRAMADSEADLRVLANRARLRFRRADGHAALRLLPEADYRRSAVAYAEDLRQLRALPGVEFLEL